MIPLFLTAWDNPRPDKKVVSIDLISASSRAAPFCVAMTIEQSGTDKGPSAPATAPAAAQKDAPAPAATQPASAGVPMLLSPTDGTKGTFYFSAISR